MSSQDFYRVVVIDIETEGQWFDCNLMAIGAAIGNLKNGEIEDSIEIYLKPDPKARAPEPRCMNRFWNQAENKATYTIIKERCESNLGLSEADAMFQLYKWLRSRPDEVVNSMIIWSDLSSHF